MDDKDLMFLADVLGIPVQELFPRREGAGRLCDFMGSSKRRGSDEWTLDSRYGAIAGKSALRNPLRFASIRCRLR